MKRSTRSRCAAETSGPDLHAVLRADADLHRCGESGQLGGEIVVDRLLDEQRGAGDADLAGMETSTRSSPCASALARSQSAKTMLADLPPSSSSVRFMRARRPAGSAANGGAAGERDHVDVGESVARASPISGRRTVDEAHDARRQDGVDDAAQLGDADRIDRATA
jgi:hypothetical protein